MAGAENICWNDWRQYNWLWLPCVSHEMVVKREAFYSNARIELCIESVFFLSCTLRCENLIIALCIMINSIHSISKKERIRRSMSKNDPENWVAYSYTGWITILFQNLSTVYRQLPFKKPHEWFSWNIKNIYDPAYDKRWVWQAKVSCEKFCSTWNVKNIMWIYRLF